MPKWTLKIVKLYVLLPKLYKGLSRVSWRNRSEPYHKKIFKQTKKLRKLTSSCKLFFKFFKWTLKIVRLYKLLSKLLMEGSVKISQRNQLESVLPKYSTLMKSWENCPILTSWSINVQNGRYKLWDCTYCSLYSLLRVL